MGLQLHMPSSLLFHWLCLFAPVTLVLTEDWNVALHWNPGSLLAPVYALSTGELIFLHCYSSTRTWGWPQVYLPAFLAPHPQTYIPNYWLLRVGLIPGFPWGPDMWRRNTLGRVSNASVAKWCILEDTAYCVLGSLGLDYSLLQFLSGAPALASFDRGHNL